jgi:hypothetical protein
MANIRRIVYIRHMPNLPDSPVEQALLPKLVDALDQVPGFAVEKHVIDNREPDHDARIELNAAGRPMVLLIECKREIFPLQAREVLWQFRHHLQSRSDVTPFVLAESITGAARDLFKAEGLGFFDTTGTLFLPADGAFVFVDKGLPRSRTTGERKLFAQRRSQAVHALLREPSRWFGVSELAQAADVAPSTASEVLGLLDKLEWVKHRGQGPAKERQLSEPSQLLDAWAAAFAAAKREPLQRYFVPKLGSQDPELAIAEVFEKAKVHYAISHESAAQRFAPFLTHVGKVRIRVVAGVELHVAKTELGVQRVDTGWNLGLWEGAEADLMFSERIDSAWFASPFFVYLDLLQAAEGRSKEAAEHLRKTRIGF